MLLQDKVAVITGASRGIGFSIAEAFIKEGAKIALCGSRMETAQKATDALLAKYPDAKILPIGANMADEDAVRGIFEKTVSTFGTLDILVNNAGITAATSFLDTETADMEKMFQVNVFGPFVCMREAAKIMKEKGGSIINTSSIMGIYGGRMQAAYASSKAAVISLTKTAAKELGRYNIRVNTVAPGVVATDMVAEAVNPETLKALQMATPLGHPGNADELAGAYVYLASDAASFTTGAILQVDGGIVM